MNFSKNKQKTTAADNKNLSDLLFIKGGNKVSYLKLNLLDLYPELVIGDLKRFDFKTNSTVGEHSDKEYIIKNYTLPKNNLYFNVKKYFGKNILGVTFALKAGRIVRTVYRQENNELYIIRDIIGTKNRKGKHFYLGIKDARRKFINGNLEINILENVINDEQALLKELEIYIGEVFRQFRYKEDLLLPEAFDATPINCIRLDNGKFHFYDFEFEIVEGITKECMLYKLIHYVCNYFNQKDKINEYYNYFRVKFNLQDKINWCEFYEYYYGSFDCPTYKLENWENYSHSFYVKFMKNLCKGITFLIPHKQLRNKWKTALINYLCYPNYRLLQKIGLEDFKFQ